MNINSLNNALEPTMLYRIHECVGKGNFGSVYKATNNLTNSVVAIKVIDLENTDDDITTITQEIFFLARLKNVYITHYITSLLDDSMLWIVMEFCGGGSCSDLLKYCYRRGLSEDKVAFITKNVLNGLDYLHRQKIIHRDIKAANILLTLDGHIKIGDFGVSGQIQTTLKRNTFVGTPYWMAPEIIAHCDSNETSVGDGYNEMADVWSLGITVYELVTGAPPLSKEDPMQVMISITNKSPPRLSDDIYSQDIKGFIINCLQREPEDRAKSSELLIHSFILINTGIIDNLKQDVMICNNMKKKYRKFRELNMERPLNQHVCDDSSYRLRSFGYDNSWDFDVSDKEAFEYQIIKPPQTESIYYSSAISSNMLKDKDRSFNNRNHNNMTVTPLTIHETSSLKKNYPCLPVVPIVASQENHRVIQAVPQNKINKYDLESGMEIDTESKSLSKSLRVSKDDEIDCVNDIIGYCFKQMDMRANEEETKAYVNTLWQTFLAIENEIPGFADVFVEEIMNRLEIKNGYLESHNCSSINM